MIAKTIGLILSFLSVIIISRLMGPDILGAIGFAFGLIGLFSGFVDFGFYTTHIKMVSEGKNEEKCLQTILLLNAIQAIALSLMVLASIVAINFFSKPMSLENIFVILIVLASTIFDFFSNSFIYTFQARQEIAKMQLPFLIGTIARFFLILGIALFYSSVVFLAISYAACSLIQLILAVSLFKKIELPSIDKKLLKEYFSFSIPLAIVGILVGIQLNIDKIFLQFFYSSIDVGKYYGTQKLSELFTIISGSIMALLLPAISFHSAKKDSEKISNLVLKSERFLSMFFMPIFGFAALFSKEIVVLLFGKEFESAWIVFGLLGFAAYVNALTRPYSANLVGSGKQNTYLKLTAFCFVLNIILDIVLIPENFFGTKMLGLGINGAAAAMALQLTVFYVLAKFASMKEIALDFKFLVPQLFATAIMLFGIFESRQFTEFNVFSIILFSFFGAITYFAVLFLSKGFSKKDFELLVNSFNPKKIAQYAKDELKQ